MPEIRILASIFYFADKIGIIVTKQHKPLKKEDGESITPKGEVRSR